MLKKGLLYITGEQFVKTIYIMWTVLVWSFNAKAYYIADYGEFWVDLVTVFSCFNTIVCPRAQRRLQKEMFCPSLVWKNVTGMHRALTSTPSSTSGMNWITVINGGKSLQQIELEAVVA